MTKALTVVIVVVAAVVVYNLWLTGEKASLAVTEEKHDYDRKISQEKRGAEAVGAVPLPVKPIVVVIKKQPGSCAQIQRILLDGDDLTTYWTWACPSTHKGFVRTMLKIKSPDGTVVGQGEYYLLSGVPAEANEKFEDHHQQYGSDPRAVEVDVALDVNVF